MSSSNIVTEWLHHIAKETDGDNDNSSFSGSSSSIAVMMPDGVLPLSAKSNHNKDDKMKQKSRRSSMSSSSNNKNTNKIVDSTNDVKKASVENQKKTQDTTPTTTIIIKTGSPSFSHLHPKQLEHDLIKVNSSDDVQGNNKSHVKVKSKKQHKMNNGKNKDNDDNEHGDDENDRNSDLDLLIDDFQDNHQRLSHLAPNTNLASVDSTTTPGLSRRGSGISSTFTTTAATTHVHHHHHHQRHDNLDHDNAPPPPNLKSTNLPSSAFQPAKCHRRSPSTAVVVSSSSEDDDDDDEKNNNDDVKPQPPSSSSCPPTLQSDAEVAVVVDEGESSFIGGSTTTLPPPPSPILNNADKPQLPDVAIHSAFSLDHQNKQTGEKEKQTAPKERKSNVSASHNNHPNRRSLSPSVFERLNSAETAASRSLKIGSINDHEQSYNPTPRATPAPFAITRQRSPSPNIAFNAAPTSKLNTTETFDTTRQPTNIKKFSSSSTTIRLLAPESLLPSKSKQHQETMKHPSQITVASAKKRSSVSLSSAFSGNINRQQQLQQQHQQSTSKYEVKRSTPTRFQGITKTRSQSPLKRESGVASTVLGDAGKSLVRSPSHNDHNHHQNHQQQQQQNQEQTATSTIMTGKSTIGTTSTTVVSSGIITTTSSSSTSTTKKFCRHPSPIPQDPLNIKKGVSGVSGGATPISMTRSDVVPLVSVLHYPSPNILHHHKNLKPLSQMEMQKMGRTDEKSYPNRRRPTPRGDQNHHSSSKNQTSNATTKPVLTSVPTPHEISSYVACETARSVSRSNSPAKSPHVEYFLCQQHAENKKTTAPCITLCNEKLASCDDRHHSHNHSSSLVTKSMNKSRVSYPTSSSPSPAGTAPTPHASASSPTSRQSLQSTSVATTSQSSLVQQHRQQVLVRANQVLLEAQDVCDDAIDSVLHREVIRQQVEEREAASYYEQLHRETYGDQEQQHQKIKTHHNPSRSSSVAGGGDRLQHRHHSHPRSSSITSRRSISPCPILSKSAHNVDEQKFVHFKAVFVDPTAGRQSADHQPLTHSSEQLLQPNSCAPSVVSFSSHQHHHHHHRSVSVASETPASSVVSRRVDGNQNQESRNMTAHHHNQQYVLTAKKGVHHGQYQDHANESNSSIKKPPLTIPKISSLSLAAANIHFQKQQQQQAGSARNNKGNNNNNNSTLLLSTNRTSFIHASSSTSRSAINTNDDSHLQEWLQTSATPRRTVNTSRGNINQQQQQLNQNAGSFKFRPTTSTLPLPTESCDDDSDDNDEDDDRQQRQQQHYERPRFQQMNNIADSSNNTIMVNTSSSTDDREERNNAGGEKSDRKKRESLSTYRYHEDDDVQQHSHMNNNNNRLLSYSITKPAAIIRRSSSRSSSIAMLRSSSVVSLSSQQQNNYQQRQPPSQQTLGSENLQRHQQHRVSSFLYSRPSPQQQLSPTGATSNSPRQTLHVVLSSSNAKK